MPELPDVTVYIEALEARIAGATLERVRLASPFLLRSVDPPIAEATNRRVIGLRRLGKRIVIGLEGDLFLVLHLMIAGRLRWKAAGAKPPGKIGLAAFDFSTGTLLLTEAGTKRRAALYFVRGEAALAEHDPGGLEVLDTNVEAFRAALARENHTLKRALTDPGILSGIGNAYSDEILHRAKLSPVKQTRQLSAEEDCAPLRGHPRHPARLVRADPRAGGRRVPGGRHGVSRGDGRARALRQAVPGLRIAGAADRLCRQRDQLLRASARPAAGSSPTARCHACSSRTGRARSRSSRSAVRPDAAA